MPKSLPLILLLAAACWATDIKVHHTKVGDKVYYILECSANTTKNDFELLQRIGEPQLTQLDFFDCPLQDDAIDTALAHLGIESVKFIKLDFDFRRLDLVLVPPQLTHVAGLRKLEAKLFVKNMTQQFFDKSRNVRELKLTLGSLSFPGTLLYPLEDLESLELLVAEFYDQNIFIAQKNLKHLKMRCVVYNTYLSFPPYILQHMVQLETFSLESCIISVPIELFYTMHNLKKIRIENKLVRLHKDFLKDQPQLDELTLNHNSLKELPLGLLRNTKALRILNLDHNDLKAIADHDFKDLPQLEILSLEDNPLVQLESLAFASVQHQIYLGDNFESFRTNKLAVRNTRARICKSKLSVQKCLIIMDPQQRHCPKDCVCEIDDYRPEIKIKCKNLAIENHRDLPALPGYATNAL